MSEEQKVQEDTPKEVKSKEQSIYEFFSGSIDFLPVDHLQDVITIVDSMLVVKLREVQEKKIVGFPLARLQRLGVEAEKLIFEMDYPKASIRLREMYKILNF